MSTASEHFIQPYKHVPPQSVGFEKHDLIPRSCLLFPFTCGKGPLRRTGTSPFVSALTAHIHEGRRMRSCLRNDVLGGTIPGELSFDRFFPCYNCERSRLIATGLSA